MATTLAQGFMWVGLLGFLGAVIYTLVVVGQASGSNDSKKEISQAIFHVVIVNIVLLVVLAGTAYFYVAAEPLAERPYIMIMLHVSLLISLVSVSISSLHQLNTSPTTSTTPVTGGGSCTA